MPQERSSTIATLLALPMLLAVARPARALNCPPDYCPGAPAQARILYIGFPFGNPVYFENLIWAQEDNDCTSCGGIATMLPAIDSIYVVDALEQPASYFASYDIIAFGTSEFPIPGVTDAQLLAAPWQSVIVDAKRALVTGVDWDDINHNNWEGVRRAAHEAVEWLVEDECCPTPVNTSPAVLAMVDARREPTVRYAHLPWPGIHAAALPPPPICGDATSHIAQDDVDLVVDGPWGSGKHPILAGNDQDASGPGCPTNSCSLDRISNSVHGTFLKAAPGGYEADDFVSIAFLGGLTCCTSCSDHDWIDCGGVPWGGMEVLLVRDRQECGPACDAGGPYAGCPGATLTLTGSGSVDPLGETLQYEWTTDCVGTLANDHEAVAELELDSDCAQDCSVTLTVTTTVTGRQSTCTAGVTVTNAAPTMTTCPAPLSLPCTVVGGIEATDPAIVAWLSSFVVDDDCGAPAVTNDLSAQFPGGLIPTTCAGTPYTITFTATDACGQSVQCTATLAVTDSGPPTFLDDSVQFFEECLWPPNHKWVCLVGISSRVTVLDDCSSSGSLVVQLSSVKSSQCEDAPCPEHPGENGDGSTAPDWTYDAGTDTLCLRSERAGTEPEGRFYDVGFIAIDGCGNTSAEAIKLRVHVPHDQRDPLDRDCYSSKDSPVTF